MECSHPLCREYHKGSLEMKRYVEIVLLAGVVALLTGCVIGHDRSSGEAVELSLRAVVSHRTRSAEDTDHGFSTTFPTDTDFGMWAFSLPRDRKWEVFRPDAEPLATNAKCSYGVSDGLWHPEQKVAWHYPEALTLIAYAPYDLAARLDPRQGLVIEEFDMSESGEVDILYTDYLADRLMEENTLGVNMPFYHALAKVDIKAQCVLPKGYEIVVHKIAVEGVATRGTFTSHPEPEWIAEGALSEVVLYQSDEGWDLTANNGAYVEEADGLFVPQSQHLTLRIETELTSGGFAAPRVFRTPLLNVVWEAGKYYTYSLYFSNDEVRVEEPQKQNFD